VIVTEWNEFRALDIDRLKGLMKTPVLVDLRNIYDPSEIRAELGEHDFDVVLAYFSQREAVTAQTTGSDATFIPVAARDTDEEREARSLFERSLSSDDSVKTFLKTIHRTLKSRG